MSEQEPNFSQYSDNELSEVLKYIDKESYPERYKSLVKEIEDRKNGVAVKTEVIEEPVEERPKVNKKSVQMGILIIWSVLSSLFLFFGAIPAGRHFGWTRLEEDPSFFAISLCLFLFLGAIAYVAAGNDDYY